MVRHRTRSRDAMDAWFTKHRYVKRSSAMKYVLISAAALVMIVSPSLAQTQSQSAQQRAQTQQRSTTGSAPRLFVGPGVVSGNKVYDCTGKYLGEDPDPNVRATLLRQGEQGGCSD
jgi:hypothetical protein